MKLQIIVGFTGFCNGHKTEDKICVKLCREGLFVDCCQLFNWHVH